MRNKLFLTLAGTVALFGVGCTPEARQDLDQAGDKIGSATEKSAEGTAQAVNNAGEKVAEETAEAGREIKQGAENAAEVVNETVGGAAKKTVEGAEQLGAAATITPKVKTALAADKGIDAATLNVTVDEKAKTVIIEGTQATDAKKNMVTSVAQKAVADVDSAWKINNKVQVKSM